LDSSKYSNGRLQSQSIIDSIKDGIQKDGYSCGKHMFDAIDRETLKNSTIKSHASGNKQEQAQKVEERAFSNPVLSASLADSTKQRASFPQMKDPDFVKFSSVYHPNHQSERNFIPHANNFSSYLDKQPLGISATQGTPIQVAIQAQNTAPAPSQTSAPAQEYRSN
jgi:hypothetical protein